jgi:hypothetical protein
MMLICSSYLIIASFAMLKLIVWRLVPNVAWVGYFVNV